MQLAITPTVRKGDIVPCRFIDQTIDCEVVGVNYDDEPVICTPAGYLHALEGCVWEGPTGERLMP